MGDLLFIRVSAQTYDEERVPKQWPALFRTAYPEGSINASKGDSASGFHQSRGVLEMIAALSDQYHFGDLDDAIRQVLKPVIAQLETAVHNLEGALADRNAQKAHELTNTIETLLSDAEKEVQPLAPRR